MTDKVDLAQIKTNTPTTPGMTDDSICPIKNDETQASISKTASEMSLFSTDVISGNLTPRINLFSNFYSKEVSDTLSIMLNNSVKEDSSVINNIFSGNIQKANELFNNQLISDGLCADCADFISKLWFSDNTATKVRRDLTEAKKQLDYLNAVKDDYIEYKIRFKKVFGVDYSSKNIKEYTETEKLFNELMINIGSQKSFDSNFYLILHNENCQEEYTYEQRGQYGFTKTLSATKEKVFEREFNKIATMFGKNGRDVLNKLLKKHNMENSSIDEKWKFLRTILLEEAKKIKLNTEESYKKLGVSSVEEAKNKFEKAYSCAFGDKNNILERVNKYNTSQQIGAGIIQGIIIAGITMSIVASAGTATPVIAVSDALGISSSVLLSTATAASAAGTASVVDDFTSGTKKSLKQNSNYGSEVTYRDALDNSFSNEGIPKTILDMFVQGCCNIDFEKVATSAMTSGSLAFVMGGTNVCVKNICDVAKMSTASTLATCFVANTGTGIAANKLMSGEITVKGVTYVLIFNIVGTALQLVGLMKGTQTQLKEARSDLAKLRLNIETDPKLTSIADKMQGKPVTIENLDALRRDVLLTLGDGSKTGTHINELAKNIIEKIDLIKKNIYFFPEEKFEFKPQRYLLEYKGQTVGNKSNSGTFVAESTELGTDTGNSYSKPHNNIPKTNAAIVAEATDLSADTDSSSRNPTPKSDGIVAAVTTNLTTIKTDNGTSFQVSSEAANIINDFIKEHGQPQVKGNDDVRILVCKDRYKLKIINKKTTELIVPKVKTEKLADAIKDSTAKKVESEKYTEPQKLPKELQEEFLQKFKDEVPDLEIKEDMTPEQIQDSLNEYIKKYKIFAYGEETKDQVTSLQNNSSKTTSKLEQYRNEIIEKAGFKKEQFENGIFDRTKAQTDQIIHYHAADNILKVIQSSPELTEELQFWGGEGGKQLITHFTGKPAARVNEIVGTLKPDYLDAFKNLTEIEKLCKFSKYTREYIDNFAKKPLSEFPDDGNYAISPAGKEIFVDMENRLLVIKTNGKINSIMVRTGGNDKAFWNYFNRLATEPPKQ